SDVCSSDLKEEDDDQPLDDFAYIRYIDADNDNEMDGYVEKDQIITQEEFEVKQKENQNKSDDDDIDSEDNKSEDDPEEKDNDENNHSDNESEEQQSNDASQET